MPLTLQKFTEHGVNNNMNGAAILFLLIVIWSVSGFVIWCNNLDYLDSWSVKQFYAALIVSGPLVWFITLILGMAVLVAKGWEKIWDWLE